MFNVSWGRARPSPFLADLEVDARGNHFSARARCVLISGLVRFRFRIGIAFLSHCLRFSPYTLTPCTTVTRQLSTLADSGSIPAPFSRFRSRAPAGEFGGSSQLQIKSTLPPFVRLWLIQGLQLVSQSLRDYTVEFLHTRARNVLTSAVSSASIFICVARVCEGFECSRGQMTSTRAQSTLHSLPTSFCACKSDTRRSARSASPWTQAPNLQASSRVGKLQVGHCERGCFHFVCVSRRYFRRRARK